MMMKRPISILGRRRRAAPNQNPNNQRPININSSGCFLGRRCELLAPWYAVITNRRKGRHTKRERKIKEVGQGRLYMKFDN